MREERVRGKRVSEYEGDECDKMNTCAAFIKLKSVHYSIVLNCEPSCAYLKCRLHVPYYSEGFTYCTIVKAPRTVL